MDPEAKLLELEAKLIEQEHRPFQVIATFFRAREQWSPSDPRRTAVWKALLWRVLFSPTTVAATGGTIAVASLAAFIWQNLLIREQNEYFREQLTQQQRQVDLQ